MDEENQGKLCCIPVLEKTLLNEILKNEVSGFEKVKCPLRNSFAIGCRKIVKKERDLRKVEKDFNELVARVKKEVRNVVMQCSPSNGCFCFYQDWILQHPSPEHTPVSTSDEENGLNM